MTDKILQRRAEADGPVKAEAAGWAAAETLADLARLMGEWLRGDRGWSPLYGGRPDPETYSEPQVLPTLVALNDAGMLTDFSQPGLLNDGPWRQRASVGGFVEHEAARYAQHLAVTSDLIVIDTYKPIVMTGTEQHSDCESLVSIAVTANGGQPYTWTGRTESAQELFWHFEVVSPKAWPACFTAVGLQIVDPVWGRNSVLWPWLQQYAADLRAGKHLQWCEQNPLDEVQASLCQAHA